MALARTYRCAFGCCPFNPTTHDELDGSATKSNQDPLGSVYMASPRDLMTLRSGHAQFADTRVRRAHRVRVGA
jgi:hypothetical protein